MSSVDCSYSSARQLQIHLESEKKPLMTPWRWLSNRSKKRDKESSSLFISSNGLTPGYPKFTVDSEFHKDKLIDSNISTAVVLPDGIELNEWYATQTIFLFDCINMLFGCLCEFCNAVSCPTMSGPLNVQYYWPDDKGKKAKLSAPQYIDCVTSYANSCIKDESIFPTKYGNVFPPTFHQTIKNIHRLLCHVLIHMQHAHTSHLKLLHLSSHYTTVLQHFLLFNKNFPLANEVDLALFEGIHEVLNAPPPPTNVPDAKNNTSSDLPCGEVHPCGESSPQRRNTSFTQTSMMKSDVREDTQADSIAVDKYVPVFTIVT